MEATTIIGGMAIAGAAAAGLRLCAGLIPIGLQAYRDLNQLKDSPAYRLREESRELQAARHALANPQGQRRESSICGCYEDCLRHVDGAYTRIYEIFLEPSMFEEEAVIERRCDDVARTLCAELPAGTMAQIRYRVDRDLGRAIAEHFRERRYENIYLPAAYLHDSNLEFLQAKAARGFYRYERALLVLRFPASHPADAQSKGMSAYLPDLCGQLSRGGVKSFFQSLKDAPSHPAFRGVVDRIQAHEAEAFRQADLVMRRFEMEFPVRLRQLTGRELWEVLYQSHNLSARSVPNVTIRPGDDLRDYLCAEPIEYCGSYVKQGDVPLMIISMHAPPDGGIYADSSRLHTARADLAFPHTICTEYIALDRAEAKKRLLQRAKLVEEDTKKADGRARRDYDARAALADIENMLAHIAASREALVQCRCYAIVQGDPVKNLAELKESLKVLEQRAEILESALKRIEGADVRREEPEAVRCLYQGMLLGEMSPEPTGREIQEVAHSLAALAPLETAWQGSPHSHSVFGTVSGRLTKPNFFRVTSPFMTVFGVPGAGKSVTLATLIVDALATMPGCRVHAVDIGGSLAPLAEVLGARYFRLNPEDKRTLNIFDSPELAGGEMPGEETIALILMHMMTLANVKDDNERAQIVLTKAIKSVLKNFVPRNGNGQPKREPTLKHLVAKLRAYQFENDRDKACAEDLASALDVHVGDPWLDAPTHPDFDAWSPFDVYELDSLEKFPQLVRQLLAGVIASRVIRSIGKKNEDGEYMPTLLVFDEAHRYAQDFPGIMKVIARGARQGRKANVLTCVLTHTYDDFEGMHDLTATAGIRLIGLQTGDISRLVADAQLSDRAVAAINAIRNVAGSHAQFVLQIGSGADQQIELIQLELSPLMLWTCTTNPLEQNARERVQRLTGCSMLEAVTWLSTRYPRGLVLEGLQAIDESLLFKQ